MDAMPAPRWQLPRLDRDDRWVGGVAAAIAREVGVQPMVIRVSFVVLATVGGWGLVLYAVAWAVLAVATPDRISPYRPQPKGATSAHRHLGVAMVVVGIIIVLRPLANDAFDVLVWPVGFVLTGALIAWSRSRDDSGGLSAIVRVVAGVSVAVGGMLAFAALQFDLIETAIALVFGIAILAGIVLVAAPSVVRMARDLDGERLERTRADERARISAHLHDSVLQSLSLIQRNASDPQLAARIARQQERELRTWLYGRPPTTPDGLRLASALQAAADRVEEQHGVVIEVVTVGDTDDLDAGEVGELLAATSEALTNAARHSGVERIDVYAERRNGSIDVFVRDTGRGFDPDSIHDDRKGVTESIIGRMRRAGGDAHVFSAPGRGTEIELTLPLPAPAEPGSIEPGGAAT